MSQKNWIYPSGDGVSWNDANNWEDDSSGFKGVPGVGDTAVIMVNNLHLVIDAPAACISLSFAGYTGGSIAFNSTLNLSGALVLVAGMTITGDKSKLTAGSKTDPDGWFTQYTVTADVLYGTIDSTNPLTVWNHDSAVFTITPTSGYIYDAIDNTSGTYGGVVYSGGTLTFSNVASNSAARVKFKVGSGKLFGVSCSKLFGVVCTKVYS